MNDSSHFTSLPPEDVNRYLGQRIVLTSRSEISFCGVAHSVIEVSKRRGMLLETDSRSGFSVWCPLDYIKSITVIPIPVEKSSLCSSEAK